jgi:hypothetical protein
LYLYSIVFVKGTDVGPGGLVGVRGLTRGTVATPSIGAAPIFVIELEQALAG